MMPEKISEKNIKDIFKSRNFAKGLSPACADCPTDEDLAGYISGEIFSDKREQISAHIGLCQRCLDIVATSLKVLSEQDAEDAPKDAIKKVLSISKKYPRKGAGRVSVFKKNKYLLVAGVFFILSFVLKKYFMQCLLAAGIFGVKWIMDTGSTKALIMIYDAWKTRKESDDNNDNRVSRKNRDTSRFL
jgi:hypothetical protein